MPPLLAWQEHWPLPLGALVVAWTPATEDLLPQRASLLPSGSMAVSLVPHGGACSDWITSATQGH